MMILIQVATVAMVLYGLILLARELARKFPQVKQYWDNGVIPIFLAVVTFHLGLYWIFPKFWVILYNHSGFTTYQIIFWFGVYVATRKNSVVRVVGVTLVLLSMIGLGYSVYDAYGDASVLPAKTEVQSASEKFWQYYLMPKAATDMLVIESRVSHFNQFEEDGITALRSKKTGYVCAMQIEEERWLPQAIVLGEDYNMQTLDGCLNMALWIRNYVGVEAWSANDEIRRRANRKPIVIKIPRGGLSEKFSTVPGPTNISEDGPITILTNDGRNVTDSPEVQDGQMGKTKWVRFQSLVEETVNVTLTRQ